MTSLGIYKLFYKTQTTSNNTHMVEVLMLFEDLTGKRVHITLKIFGVELAMYANFCRISKGFCLTSKDLRGVNLKHCKIIWCNVCFVKKCEKKGWKTDDVSYFWSWPQHVALEKTFKSFNGRRKEYFAKNCGVNFPLWFKATHCEWSHLHFSMSKEPSLNRSYNF